MTKLVARILAAVSGDAVSKVDSAGTTSDILPGDVIEVVRNRGGTRVVLSTKQGAAMQTTVPVALNTPLDALAVSVSIRLVFRAKDDADAAMTNAVIAALYRKQLDGTIEQVNENPWA
jgi:hypothetical protein